MTLKYSIRSSLPRAGDLLPEHGPGRALAAAVFVNSFGTGLYFVVGIVYLVRFAGLPLAQVGLGLTLTGVAALIAGIPAGVLSDRYDPRVVAAGFLLCEALAVSALVWVRSFPTFLAAALLSALASQGSRTVRGVLIGRIGGQGRARLRATMRSVSNLSQAAGALAAGLVLQWDHAVVYQAALLVDAASFVLAAAVIVRQLPAFARVAAPKAGPRLAVVHDRKFAAIALLNGAMSMHYSVLGVMLPVWITQYTSAPRWAASATLLLNTILIVLFQVPASRGVTDAASAQRWFRRSGWLFLAACVLLAATRHFGPFAALVMLLAAAVTYTVGELWHAASSFELSYALAPEHQMGQYQGMFGMGVNGGGALAPALLAALCPLGGGFGWVLVGLVFAAVGLAIGSLHLTTRQESSYEPIPS